MEKLYTYAVKTFKAGVIVNAVAGAAFGLAYLFGLVSVSL